ncbi:MAG TPA: VOC family protein [Myxococcota bacterium]|nr:VOC family protein [Myxococcota bacterium]
MEPRLSLVTLGVAELDRAVEFYERVLRLPRRETPSSIAIFELGKTWIALYPRELLAADAGVPPEGSGFAGFTLSHNVASREKVDRLLEEVQRSGGNLVKRGHVAEWGGYSGYFSDPDGFLWEVAWNPGFPHV